MDDLYNLVYGTYNNGGVTDYWSVQLIKGRPAVGIEMIFAVGFSFCAKFTNAIMEKQD